MYIIWNIVAAYNSWKKGRGKRENKNTCQAHNNLSKLTQNTNAKYMLFYVGKQMEKKMKRFISVGKMKKI